MRPPELPGPSLVCGRSPSRRSSLPVPERPPWGSYRPWAVFPAASGKGPHETPPQVSASNGLTRLPRLLVGAAPTRPGKSAPHTRTAAGAPRNTAPPHPAAATSHGSTVHGLGLGRPGANRGLQVTLALRSTPASAWAPCGQRVAETRKQVASVLSRPLCREDASMHARMQTECFR